jgi:hypothetical protein
VFTLIFEKLAALQAHNKGVHPSAFLDSRNGKLSLEIIPFVC